MPNWCMTSMVIEGHKADVEKIRALLLDWTSREYHHSDFGKNWLGNIVLGAGFKTSDEDDEGLYCRGFIDSIGDVMESKDGMYSFLVEYESAWKPLPDMWKAIMQKHAPYCGVYWYAEEPGSEVFETNDLSKKHFDMDYVVDSYVEDKKNPLSSAFDGIEGFTKDGLKKCLESLFGKGTLEGLIRKAENVPLAEDEWFSIHKIQYEV